ncbi:MAG: glycoside hydrolase family 99-like domain-containing protein [Planctomycetia bacterium]|nr:glycoside hydrolase family 99-like domain-containing protein [Planctomycetia bacterium]
MMKHLITTTALRMSTLRMYVLGVCLLVMTGSLSAQTTEDGSKILFERNFDSQQECDSWSTSQMTELHVSNGILTSKFTGRDPFITLPGLDFAPKCGQVVEIRMKSDGWGDGEFYFTSTNEGQYGGFSPKKMNVWHIIHDGKWHVYQIHPSWTVEKKIIKVRMDFGAPGSDMYNGNGVEIDYIRFIDFQFDKAQATVPQWNADGIQEDWTVTKEAGQAPESGTTTFTSRVFSFEADEFGTWLYFELKTKPGANISENRQGTLRFWGSDSKGIAEIAFPLKNRDFIYNLDLAGETFWSGKIYQMELVLPTAEATLAELKVSDTPCGPPCLDSLYSGMRNALNRTGQKVDYLLRVKNIGGTAIKNAKIELVREGNWNGVSLVGTASLDNKQLSDNVIETLDPMTQHDLLLSFRATNPGTYNGKVKINGSNWSGELPIKVEVTPSVHLPAASYVPEPKPVKSKYSLGALYFPGWNKRNAWDRIDVSQPVRKPVLGWYDESNPEVIDWQIKWAAETGIQFFLVDWYWSHGSQHLDHWIAGYRQAKYRSYLKWAMMWANHNGPGSHSEEDTRAVTQFWIENYFNMPEYLRIDDQPVVVIWSPDLMDNDIIAIERTKGHELKRGEGVKKILDLSRQLAREAGYKGIYFVAMKFPEEATDEESVQWLKDGGFDCTSLYHFMHHGNKVDNSRKFSFDLVVDATLPYLESRAKTGILPYFPNISTGWDSRPWHGEKGTIIYDRTVEKFRKICEDVKGFVDRTKAEPIVLAPLNEWGEGSYIEPNVEFGFGMYEVIRETFCEKPAGGFPPYFGPTDVGLGPYDLPPTPPVVFRSNWDFSDGTDQGWRALMGMDDFAVIDGTLKMKTTSADPAVSISFPLIKAREWKRLIVRMKVTGAAGHQDSQLFWVPNNGVANERGSLRLPLINDGQYHDYVFELAKAHYWRGVITGFRFDPVNQADCEVEIDSIRLE